MKPQNFRSLLFILLIQFDTCITNKCMIICWKRRLGVMIVQAWNNYHQSTLLYMTSFSPSTWAMYLAAVNRKSLNLYDKWNRYTLVALDSTLALWYCSIEMTLLANMCTSLPEMGVLQLRREGCFSACLCTGGEKWSTLCQSRSF